MSAEAEESINARLKELGTGVPMPGEGGDRKFAAHGLDWRVRVRVLDEVPPAAPTNGAPELAPKTVGIIVSVAALNSNDAVMADDLGRLLVFDGHVLTLQSEAFARAGYDPQRDILIAVAGQIDAAYVQLESRKRLPKALDAWRA